MNHSSQRDHTTARFVAQSLQLTGMERSVERWGGSRLLLRWLQGQQLPGFGLQHVGGLAKTGVLGIFK